MAESSLLATTAEVSVAFAGFIGIFLVLAARDGRFPPADAFQIRLIVTFSVAPVFFAVLPLILALLGLSGSLLWRVCSMAAGSACIGALAYLLRQLQALEAGQGRAINYGVVLGVVATLACAGNVLGWPWTPAGGVYLVMVWSIVGIAAGNFVELLFRKLL